LRIFSEVDDALADADADGAVRKDFRMSDAPMPFEHRTINERVVDVGQQVCALAATTPASARSCRRARR
jgi:hypothetical protein